MQLYQYLAMVSLAALASVSKVETTTGCTKLMTFNAAMLPSFENYPRTRSEVPNALRRQGADIYCLQEYWQECDMEVLLNELRTDYRHHYSAIHSSPGRLQCENDVVTSPCSIPEVTYFNTVVLSCAQQNGCLQQFAVSPAAGTQCIAQNCASQLKAVNITADCISCITLYGNPTIDEGVNRCIPSISCNKRLNSPGLVLLSKKRIKRAHYVSYFPDRQMTFQRGYLEAEIEGFGKVVCTHLTSIFPAFVEYDSLFNNYEEQQTAEIDNLVGTFCGMSHTLLGDFNTGPEVERTGVSASFPDHYYSLIDSGYSAPYLTDVGECTFCNIDENGTSVLIDQILNKLQPYNVRSAERVFHTQSFKLSDHYGVQIEMCPNEEE